MHSAYSAISSNRVGGCASNFACPEFRELRLEGVLGSWLPNKRLGPAEMPLLECGPGGPWVARLGEAKHVGRSREGYRPPEERTLADLLVGHRAMLKYPAGPEPAPAPPGRATPAPMPP